jgi:RNA polymerase sigma-70 factor (ECF subfamily)
MSPLDLVFVGVALAAAREKDPYADAQRRDREEMAATARGDHRALGHLYDRYGRLVFSLAVRVVEDHHDAEEVTQDVFLRLWHHAAAFDPRRGDLISWLVAVTRNRSIDHLRSKVSRETDHWVPLPEGFEAHLRLVSEPAITGVEAAQRLDRALAALPSTHRTVLELAYYEGFAQSEIAERLALPLGTVKTWTRTALQALREAMHL